MPPVTLQLSEQFVTFRLAGETYGIPITSVQEIIRICEITRIPRSFPYVRGVVNLRGNIVPVMDLRMRLGLPPTVDDAGARIIIVEAKSGVVGLIVDGVSQVKRIPNEQVEPARGWIAGRDSDLVESVAKLDEELIILLDVNKALQTD